MFLQDLYFSENCPTKTYFICQPTIQRPPIDGICHFCISDFFHITVFWILELDGFSISPYFEILNKKKLSDSVN